MKALVYTGPETLEYRDEPEPDGGGEIVVQVEACGICGSDMHAYLGHDERRPAPLVLGHEVAGIAQSGTFAGQRVTINPLVTCMSCPSCLEGRTNLCPSRVIISMPQRPGGFAEFVSVPERNLPPVNDDIDVGVASLTEPVAVTYHGINLAADALFRPISSASVIVIGGGAIGVASAGVLLSRGVTKLRLAETSALRRKALGTYGRFEVFDPAAQPDLENVADLVVDAVGLEATRALACRLVRPGGVM
ncbi:MAG: alcohol dehydrogenase catalytic domain-containing protein, partial [Hyphomicrobiaceae bacterium]